MKAIEVVEQRQPVHEGYVPQVEVTPAQAKALVQKLDEIKKGVLRDKVDYDTIPGTQKPTLLKPGAERLLQFFGLGHKVQCVEKVLDWEKGFFYFCYRVTIVKTYPTHEIVVAECEGSCNSKESKYAWRWVTEQEVRAMGLDPKNLLSKEFKGKNGRPFKKYRVPNDDIYSQVNTIQKMAIKRALVGATLQATGTSEFFTQDIEDNPEAFGLDPEPTPEPPKPKQQRKAEPKQPEPAQPVNDRAQYFEGFKQAVNNLAEMAPEPKEMKEDLEERKKRGRQMLAMLAKNKGLTEDERHAIIRNKTKGKKSSSTELTLDELLEMYFFIQETSADELKKLAQQQMADEKKAGEFDNKEIDDLLGKKSA